MTNYRFPHTCEITRGGSTDVQDYDLEGSVSDVTVYKGSCRRELKLMDNRHYRDTSETSTWMLSLPIVAKIKYGDKVVATDEVGELEGFIVDYEVTNIEHENEDNVHIEYCNGEPFTEDIVGTTTRGFHIHVKTNKN